MDSKLTEKKCRGSFGHCDRTGQRFFLFMGPQNKRLFLLSGSPCCVSTSFPPSGDAKKCYNSAPVIRANQEPKPNRESRIAQQDSPCDSANNELMSARRTEQRTNRRERTKAQPRSRDTKEKDISITIVSPKGAAARIYEASHLQDKPSAAPTCQAPRCPR